MSVKCKDIISIIENIAPPCLASKWDNVGLLIGDDDFLIDTVLFSLDISDKVCDEAIKNGANLIITHHPLIFSPLKSINLNNYKEKIIYKIITNNINVYSAHTNLDIAEHGINDCLAKLLELTDVEVLEKAWEDKYKELGFGRVGYLSEPMPLEKLCHKVKDLLDIEYVNVVGQLKKQIRKIGVCSGSASDFIKKAYEAECDVYITGDVKYHDACDARDMGLAVIDAGHFATENIYMKHFYNNIRSLAANKNYEIKMILSKINSNPFEKV
jgi:dinuclear metal center YbgI/SA1388 family protein